MTWLRLFPLLLSGLVVACAPFQDSPFSDQVLHSDHDLNAKATAGITDVEADGVIRIAIFADSHQNYKALDRVIAEINKTPDVDFVVNLGDATNSAYNLEYDQYMISDLEVRRPVINVIGNHDAIGAGPNIFKKIFGPLNFFFESSSARYIFFNSANLESPGDFDPHWLLDTVSSSTKPVFIFTHTPLIDPERFVDADKTLMDTVIAHANTKVVFNGHQHVYDFQNLGGTMLVQDARVSSGTWLLVEITGTQFEVREINGGGSISETLKP